MVQCIKLGREAEGLDFPPYPGELGQRIFDLILKTASGQKSKSELMGFGDDEFAPWVVGAVM